MKKVLKILLGFPIGVAVLVLAYILIGAIDGSAKFAEEVSKLTEYKYMLAQVAFAGIDYIIVAYAMKTIKDTFTISEDNSFLTWKGLGKFLLVCLVVIPVAIILSNIIDRKGTLNGYVGEVFFGITVLGMIVIGVGYGIYYGMQLKKINKALKEKQKGK